jgi:hypothetical protein
MVKWNFKLKIKQLRSWKSPEEISATGVLVDAFPKTSNLQETW